MDESLPYVYCSSNVAKAKRRFSRETFEKSLGTKTGFITPILIHEANCRFLFYQKTPEVPGLKKLVTYFI